MAALLGLLTGLLAFLPNIGAIVSGVLMVAVGFSAGTEAGLWAIFVYFFVQNVDGYLVVPYIARRTVDLAPALVLAAQLHLRAPCSGSLGLLLADPIVASVKVALEELSKRGDEEPALTERPAGPDPLPGGSARRGAHQRGVAHHLLDLDVEDQVAVGRDLAVAGAGRAIGERGRDADR